MTHRNLIALTATTAGIALLSGAAQAGTRASQSNASTSQGSSKSVPKGIEIALERASENSNVGAVFARMQGRSGGTGVGHANHDDDHPGRGRGFDRGKGHAGDPD